MNEKKSCRIRGLIIGAFLGLGAPIGSLLVRLVKIQDLSFEGLLNEIYWHELFYGYMTVATPIVFATYGYVLGAFLDHLADQKMALEHLNWVFKRQSITDFLTGISNHRFVLEQTEKEMERAKRYRRSLSCLMVDLDNFKKINDRYGHLIGDRVLTEVATAFQRGIRKIDSVGRYGGDEFTILLPEATSEIALYVANKIQKNVVEQHFGRPEHFITTSVSIGIATFHWNENCTASQLIERADDALLRAKRLGKNKICFDVPIASSSTEREFSHAVGSKPFA